MQYTGPNKHEFGLEKYSLPKTVNTQYPVHSKIFPYKKKTYLDIEAKNKEHVPNKYYDVAGDLRSKSVKSALDQGKRKTFVYEIANFERINGFPSPNQPIANRSLVVKKDLACLNLKGERHSFIEDAQYRGQTSPDYYRKSYEQVDAKVIVPTYKKKIRADYD